MVAYIGVNCTSNWAANFYSFISLVHYFIQVRRLSTLIVQHLRHKAICNSFTKITTKYVSYIGERSKGTYYSQRYKQIQNKRITYPYFDTFNAWCRTGIKLYVVCKLPKRRNVKIWSSQKQNSPNQKFEGYESIGLLEIIDLGCISSQAVQ